VAGSGFKFIVEPDAYRVIGLNLNSFGFEDAVKAAMDESNAMTSSSGAHVRKGYVNHLSKVVTDDPIRDEDIVFGAMADEIVEMVSNGDGALMVDAMVAVMSHVKYGAEMTPRLLFMIYDRLPDGMWEDFAAACSDLLDDPAFRLGMRRSLLNAKVRATIQKDRGDDGIFDNLMTKAITKV
jgi:hypothetical protein